MAYIEFCLNFNCFSNKETFLPNFKKYKNTKHAQDLTTHVTLL